MQNQNLELEAKFININKDEVRKKLLDCGGVLIKPEFLQKRVVFYFPKGHEIDGGWVRVRDEQDKLTMSIKIVSGSGINDQKEVSLKIDNFEEAEKFLKMLGCTRKSFQENKRELWNVGDVEIMIDEWPFVEPFVEVEGDSEEKIKDVAAKLGFKYEDALFGSAAVITQRNYGLSQDKINSIPEIYFDMENPYLSIDK
jgi:adenylate cyclase class 2